jgi:hypothetical protein
MEEPDVIYAEEDDSYKDKDKMIKEVRPPAARSRRRDKG